MSRKFDTPKYDFSRMNFLKNALRSDRLQQTTPRTCCCCGRRLDSALGCRESALQLFQRTAMQLSKKSLHVFVETAHMLAESMLNYSGMSRSSTRWLLASLTKPAPCTCLIAIRMRRRTLFWNVRQHHGRVRYANLSCQRRCWFSRKPHSDEFYDI
jgi:hypothetical protein